MGMNLETRAMLVRTRIESLGDWLDDESKTKPRAPCNAMPADQGVQQQLGAVDGGDGERARSRYRQRQRRLAQQTWSVRHFAAWLEHLQSVSNCRLQDDGC